MDAFFNQGVPYFGSVTDTYPSGQSVTTIYTSPSIAQTEQYQSILSANLVRSLYVIPYKQSNELNFNAKLLTFENEQVTYALFLNLEQEPLATSGSAAQRQIAAIETANGVLKRAYRYYVKKSEVLEPAQSFTNMIAKGWSQKMIPGLPKAMLTAMEGTSTYYEVMNYLMSSPPQVSGAASLGTEQITLYMYIPKQQRGAFSAIQEFQNNLLQSTDSAIDQLAVYAQPRAVISYPDKYQYSMEKDRALRKQPLYYNRNFYILSPSMINGMKESYTLALTGNWTFIPVSRFKAAVAEAMSSNVLQANSVTPALSTLQDGLGKSIMIPLAMGTLIPSFEIRIKSLVNDTSLSAVFESLIARLLIPVRQIDLMTVIRYDNVIAAYLQELYGLPMMSSYSILASGVDMLWTVINALPTSQIGNSLRNALLNYIGGAPYDPNGWAAPGYRTSSYQIIPNFFASYGLSVSAYLYNTPEAYDAAEYYPTRRYQQLQALATALKNITPAYTPGYARANPSGLATLIQNVSSISYQTFLYAWNRMSQNLAPLPMFTIKQPDRRVAIDIVSSALTSFITTVQSFNTTTSPKEMFTMSAPELAATSFDLNWLHAQLNNTKMSPAVFTKLFKSSLFEKLLPATSDVKSQLIALYTKIEAQQAPDVEYTKEQFWRLVEEYTQVAIAEYNLYDSFYGRAMSNEIRLEYPYVNYVALVYLPIAQFDVNSLTYESISTYLGTTPSPGSIAYMGLGDMSSNTGFRVLNNLYDLVSFMNNDNGRSWTSYVTQVTIANKVAGLKIAIPTKVSTSFLTRNDFRNSKFPKYVAVNSIADAQNVLSLFTDRQVIEGLKTIVPRLVEANDSYLYEEQKMGVANEQDRNAIALWLTSIGRGWYIMPMQNSVPQTLPLTDVITAQLITQKVPDQEYTIVTPEIDVTLIA